MSGFIGRLDGLPTTARMLHADTVNVRVGSADRIHEVEARAAEADIVIRNLGMCGRATIFEVDDHIEEPLIAHGTPPQPIQHT